MEKIKRGLCLFLVLVFLIGFFTFLFADKAAAFLINHFTGYELTYKEWGQSPFDRRRIEGLFLKSPAEGFSLYAERAFFDPDLRQLMKSGQILLKCELEEVFFKGVRRPDFLSSGYISKLLFSQEREYDQIRVEVFLDRNVVRIPDFMAVSRNIRLRGEYSFAKKNHEVFLKLKISFSPEMVETFPDDVKDNVLSPDEDGWYSTVISYRGNARLLQAVL